MLHPRMSVSFLSQNVRWSYPLAQQLQCELQSVASAHGDKMTHAEYGGNAKYGWSWFMVPSRWDQISHLLILLFLRDNERFVLRQ